MPFGRFRWREPGTKRAYDIEEIDNLEIIPRAGEHIQLCASANSLHDFHFISNFIVEEVNYFINSSPVISSDPHEGERIEAHQEVRVYLQPVDKSSWNTVQKIAKESGSSRKSKEKDFE